LEGNARIPTTINKGLCSPATDGMLCCTDAEDWVMECTQQKERQKLIFCCQLILYKIKPIFLRKCFFAASDGDVFCVMLYGKSLLKHRGYVPSIGT